MTFHIVHTIKHKSRDCMVCKEERADRLRIITLWIAAFEKGREAGFREHAELTEVALDKMRASTQTTTVCRACKGTGREEERICTLCHGVGEVKVR